MTCLMAKWMVYTEMVLSIFLEYMQCRTYFSLEQTGLTDLRRLVEYKGGTASIE